MGGFIFIRLFPFLSPLGSFLSVGKESFWPIQPISWPPQELLLPLPSAPSTTRSYRNLHYADDFNPGYQMHSSLL